MNRRDVIAAGAVLTTISGSALAQASHGEHAAASSLFDAANNCVKVGLVCSDHCLQAMASVALIGCQDCETECRKHAERHAACKACAEACAACASECKKMGA